jgi:ribonuclease PH
MTEDKKLARAGGRRADALRPVTIELGVNKFAEGSALVAFGDTRVLVTATLERRVPNWLADSGKGWLTAEYAMLPRATEKRTSREVTQGRPAARSQEIQRLIGRSLRAAVDLRALVDRTLTIDCDVLQADGGTRTAAITGAYVAVVAALARGFLAGDLAAWPLAAQVTAVSVGLVSGVPLLDLDYSEDSAAEVDLNVVGTPDGELVELQGTGEGRRFRRGELDAMLDLALGGLGELAAVQSRVLAPTLAEVAAVQARGRRTPAAPKDEKGLWGRPS